MAALVSIRRWTGGPQTPAKTNITSINTRANADDSHTTAGVNNSILIPAAGFNYSFWVTTRLSVDAITSGTVDNLRWYTDGTNNFGTGVSCVGTTATTYVQATGTPAQSGTKLTQAGYPTLASNPNDVFVFTSASPKSVTGSASTTGDLGDFLVYQMEIASSAATGATAQETFSWKYDDTSA